MVNYEVCETIYNNPITNTIIQKVLVDGKIYALKIHRILESDYQDYENSLNHTYQTCYELIKKIEGIVIIYDTWIQDCKYYVLMEYLKDYLPITVDYLSKYSLKYGDLAGFDFKKEIGLKVMGILGKAYAAKVCIVDISYGNIFMHPYTKKIKIIDIEPSILIPQSSGEIYKLWENKGYLSYQLSFAFHLLSIFIKEFLSNSPASEEELWNPKS